MILPNQASDALNLDLSKGTIRKRQGWIQKQDFSVAGAILGAFDYLKVNTSTGAVDIIHIIKAGNSLYRSVDWQAESLAVAMSETELLCAICVNNKMYFCDGTIFKVTDGSASSAVYNAAITRPSAPSAVPSVNVGNLRGTYDYKVTYYSSSWGQESAASDASATVSPLDKKVDVTLPAASSDGRVTHKRIYRRNLTNAETDWFYIAEVTNATGAYEDNTLEADVNKNILCPLSYSATLPNFRYLAYQADVLFAAGADTEPTRLYYSRAGQPWTLDQYLEVGSAADTDPITGLSAFQGVVVVWKERSIWILAGNDADSFHLRKVIPGLGCRSYHSIIEVANNLLFLSEDGFYAFDGNAVQNLSGGETLDPIGPVIRQRNYARDRYCVGVYDAENSVVLWTLTSASGAANDQLWAFFFEHSLAVGFPCWCKWDLGGTTYLARLSHPTTRERVTIIGNGNGGLGYFGGNDDNTVPIVWRWATGDIDGKDPSRFKRWGEFVVECEPQNIATTMTVQYMLNGQTWTTLVTHDMMDAILRRRLDRSSRYIRLEFSGTSDMPAEIYSFSLNFHEAGRA